MWLAWSSGVSVPAAGLHLFFTGDDGTDELFFTLSRFFWRTVGALRNNSGATSHETNRMAPLTFFKDGALSVVKQHFARQATRQGCQVAKLGDLSRDFGNLLFGSPIPGGTVFI
jgi:hypothetical protein